MAEVYLNGLTIDDLLSRIDAIVEQRVSEAINKLQQQEQESLLSVNEACKLFYPAITRQTLSSYARKHNLPQQNIGRRTFYKRGDVLNVAKSINKLKAA